MAFEICEFWKLMSFHFSQEKAGHYDDPNF
jgi:hypothetical protein